MKLLIMPTVSEKILYWPACWSSSSEFELLLISLCDVSECHSVTD